MTAVERPTRILFCSYAFHPSIGGIESVALLLAEKFVARGLDVQVVTNIASTPDSDGFSYPYPVHRRPSRRELLRLVQWSDLVFHCNISLNYVWPLLLAPRPLVIASHTPIDATIEKSALKRWMKFFVLRRASATAVSHYLASTIPAPSKVIYNPLRAGVFFLDPVVKRDKQLLFVGRLTRAKGVDVLLESLGLLKAKGVELPTTIVGNGPDERKLKEQAAELGLAGHVDFLGARGAVEVARLMNAHQVLAVPSRPLPAEALPMVPIEGIACGAVPVVARQGGLPESVGQCGVIFESDDAQGLADALERVLGSAELRAELRRPAEESLRRFDEEAIVDQYLEIFAGALPREKLRLGRAT